MQKIIIMGASSGLGAELARLFQAAGHRVGCAARSVEKIGPCQAKAAIDITRADAPQKLLALIEELGGMDVYVHVSGIGYDNPELALNRELDIIETNATGFARMTLTAFNYFAEQGRQGHIAAVTSVAGTKGIGSMEAYSATKRFGSTYLQALRQRAVTRGLKIDLTDIRPGWTRTPLLKPGERYPMLMNPQAVCRKIFRAIVRRKKVAIVDWRWAALVSLWRLLPDAIWRHIKI